LNGQWTPHDVRDQVVDYVKRWTDKTELSAKSLVGWLGVGVSKFQHWKQRYGKVNEHNAAIPRDHWLEDEEKQAILDFEKQYPLEGYRRLAFMMLDANVAAVSPTSVYRVLKNAGRLQRFAGKPSGKGTGFQQPLRPHEHWHVDVSYLNIAGTFYFLCSVLDGYSRSIVHCEIRPTMKEAETETVIQRARECHPGVTPRIITDNGPQFIARDFKDFIRLCGMTHVRTSPYYPQSNGKIERWHRTLKHDCIRIQTPLSLEDAQRIVTRFVEHYNNVRLHSALAYVTPKDKLAGREPAIFAERDRKLELARERRKLRRQALALAARTAAPTTTSTGAEDRATVGTDPSAASGAYTGMARPLLNGGRPLSTSPVGSNAINPSVISPETLSLTRREENSNSR
jgi:putative transposase